MRFPKPVRGLLRGAARLAAGLVLPAVAGADQPDLGGFKNSVAPLLERFCFECHDEATAKGNLSLESLSPDLLGGDDFEAWRIVEDQLTFREMPPEDEAQPSENERQALLGWIRGELRKTMMPGAATREKLALPQFGNYVDHEALFGQRLDRVTPAPPRLWRLRPEIYGGIASRLSDRKAALSNALNVLDGPEIKDYAAPYFLDEASATQLVSNAKLIADAQLQTGRFKALAGESPPPDEAVGKALGDAFQLALGRSPTSEERDRFLALYEVAAAAHDHTGAAQAMLAAVVLQPEFISAGTWGGGPG
ncbi:MAG: c-type cytochrome domain-containing protein [Verrucomicrobiales bacterium]